MKEWVLRNYRTIIILAFLIPIITVAVVSISHVTVWYGISNPMTWAVYLSIGIEIAALSALAAISADMGSKVYFPFGVVTLVQFIGNIYFSYQYIELASESFKDWVELVAPLLEYIGIEENDYVGHKRFLSLFTGGMLPVISLSFLHMLIKFTDEDKKIKSEENKVIEDKIDAQDLNSELSRLRLSEQDLKILEDAILNPPPPNEKMKQAVVDYRKELAKDVRDSFKQKVESEKLFNDDEDKYFNDFDRLIPENENISSYNHNDYINYVNESQKKEESTEDIKPSNPPQNASEMMLTTNDEVIESLPSDDEKSVWDLQTERQPIAIEELPENQPIPDTPEPVVVKNDETSNTDVEEKKKN